MKRITSGSARNVTSPTSLSSNARNINRSVSIRGAPLSRAGASTSGPPRHDHLLPRVELDGVCAVRMQVAEERMLPAGERIEAERLGDADVDADHPRFDALAEFARRGAARREDRGHVAEAHRVRLRDRFVER